MIYTIMLPIITLGLTSLACSLAFVVIGEVRFRRELAKRRVR